MGQKWIIDVIADLRTFADQNGLPLLAAQLDITLGIATSEMTAMLEGAPSAANRNENQTAAAFGDTRQGH